MNICDPLIQNATNYADRTALVDGDRAITFKELEQHIRRAAGDLLDNGVSAGDVVGLCLRDHARHVVAMLAAARIGAVMLPMDWRARPHEKAELTASFQAKLVLTEPKEKGLDGVETVALDAGWPGRSNAASEPHHVREASLPCLLNLSSGSTGAPKAAVLTHGQIFARCVTWWTELGMRRGLRYFSALPLAYSFGRNYLLYNLIAGNTVILHPPLYRDDEVVDAIIQRQATMAMFPATVLRRLLDISSGRAPLLRDLEILISGAAPLHPEEKRAIVERINPRLFEIYGHNGAGIVSVLRPEEIAGKSDSVGRPCFLSEIEIVDDDGARLPSGEAGWIRCRGPQVAAVPSGDEPGPSAVAAAGEGWCYTGELAAIDPTGYIYLKDRADDLINTGGFSVYPLEIERALLAHEGVREAAVVGVPCRTYGQQIVAFAVLNGTAKVRDLESHCRRRLTPHKVPRRILAVDSLPKSAAGKVLKRDLIAGLALEQSSA